MCSHYVTHSSCFGFVCMGYSKSNQVVWCVCVWKRDTKRRTKEKRKRTRESECVRENDGESEEKERKRACRSTYHHLSWSCPSQYLRHHTVIDWCCFYYFVRNSLVALLEALCARIFSLDSWISVFSDIYFLVCARSLTKPSFRPSQPGSCAWLLSFLLCADCTCVLVCVCLCVCENV